MRIFVPDTLSKLEPLLTVRMRARERQALAQPVFHGPEGLFTALHVPMQEKARGGYEVLAAAQLEGFDVLMGQQVSMSPSAVQPPQPAPLDAEELTYSVSVLLGALEETAPGRIAAYLYGDALVAPQGHAAVGLSPYAGLDVAWRMARDSLARTGMPLTEATAVSTRTILDRSERFS